MGKNFKNFALVLSVLSVSVIIAYVAVAWSEPAGIPPTGNIFAPLNTSPTAQTKQGGIGWGTTGAMLNTDQGASIELRGNGVPFIDFSNDSSTDYDGRFILTDNDMIAVDGANLNARVGLCIKGECCSSWAECVELAGGGGGGFDPSSFPCSSGVLPDSGAIKNKRIFVTSSTYDGNTFVTQWYNTSSRTPTYSSETLADAKCQALATAAGFTGGTFKALTYMGTRNINTVVPAGAIFWSCESTTGWHQVAQGLSDFFSESGGAYLGSQIYNEFGNSSGVTVWTGFEPNGGGGYTLLSTSNSSLCTSTSVGWWGGCINGTAWWTDCSGYTCSTSAVAWYGAANSVTSGWAHSGTLKSCRSDGYGYYSVQPWVNCGSVTRALYCIEQ